MTLFEGTDLGSSTPAALAGPLVRVRIDLAYDGSEFHGFAPNPGVKTVGGALGDALRRVCRGMGEMVCAGRTDGGVHAWGQVVHADIPAEAAKDLQGISRRLVKLLGPAVVVRSLEVAPDGFHARFSATGRHYRYWVLNRPASDPFLRHTAWWVPEPTPLDLPAMRLACDPLIGEHDFTSFCRRVPVGPGEEDKELVRRVRSAEWLDLGDGILRFDVSANAFCHQMVRSIVGTLVDVGRGRRKAGDVVGILDARDRRAASNPAPPHGLCLWAVDYPI